MVLLIFKRFNLPRFKLGFIYLFSLFICEIRLWLFFYVIFVGFYVCAIQGQRKELRSFSSFYGLGRFFFFLRQRITCTGGFADGFENFHHFLLCSRSRPEASKLQPVVLPPVFINKVLLEHNHAHFFTNCLWLISCYNGRVESLLQNAPQT